MSLPSRATFELQQIYWIGSALICMVDAVFMTYLVKRLLQKRRKLGAALCFSALVFGDVIFLLGYLPYHLRNAILSFTREDFSVDDDGMCIPIAFSTIISLMVMFCGVSLASYQPYFMVKSAKQMKRGGLLGRRVVFGCTFLFLCIGVTVSAVANERGMLGSYRGLYCAFRTYSGWESGLILFSASAINGVISLAFMVYATSDMKRVKRASQDQVVNAAKTLRLLSIKVAVLFVIFLAPTGLSSLVGMVGYELPAGFDLMAGWMAKLKPLADVWVILSLGMFKKGAPAPIFAGSFFYTSKWQLKRTVTRSTHRTRSSRSVNPNMKAIRTSGLNFSASLISILATHRSSTQSRAPRPNAFFNSNSFMMRKNNSRHASFEDEDDDIIDLERVLEDPALELSAGFVDESEVVM